MSRRPTSFCLTNALHLSNLLRATVKVVKFTREGFTNTSGIPSQFPYTAVITSFE